MHAVPPTGDTPAAVHREREGREPGARVHALQTVPARAGVLVTVP